jgi:peptidoglycan hydrolase-like protein with peptidoglycan-binding domain
MEDDLSAQVAALQFVLLCNGYDPVAIDGRFGAETLTAVRLAQFDRGYEETGEPTRPLFAELATACDQGRSFFFPPGETVTQSAGYAGPVHDDTIGLSGTAGQRFMLSTTGGDPVTIALLTPDGSSIEPAPVGGASVTLPTTGMYTVRVSADAPAWYLLTATLTGAGQNVDTSSIVLDADALGGLGLVDAMDPADEVIEIMNAKLGPPSHDTGEDAETGCPGVHRQVRWEIPAPDGGVPTGLVLHFHDDDGQWPEMRFTDWSYGPADWDAARPGRQGLLTTPRGITVGSPTTEAIDAYPELEFMMNALSGDVVGWSGGFELLFIADFGDGIDMATDLSTLEGHITGIRLPLDNCPDELSY